MNSFIFDRNVVLGSETILLASCMLLGCRSSVEVSKDTYACDERQERLYDMLYEHVHSTGTIPTLDGAPSLESLVNTSGDQSNSAELLGCVCDTNVVVILNPTITSEDLKGDSSAKKVVLAHGRDVECHSRGGRVRVPITMWNGEHHIIECPEEEWAAWIEAFAAGENPTIPAK